MGAPAETQYNVRLEDSVLEVSYSVFTITNEEEKMQLLQTVATAINVQLTLDGDQIPFVVSDNFQLAKSQDKLFSYGPGGCGKSRIIFELVKAKLDERIQRLYVINPRQVIDRNTRRANLMKLVDKFTYQDIVVWDNFPDGLMKKDIDTGKLALEIISSGTAKNLFIALKPKFLEMYRGLTEDIPELYSYQVRYDISQIKEIIRQYGTRIIQFKEVYASYVAKNITDITKVLWQKEPFPITIFNYYRELAAKQTSKRILDVIAEAQAMLYPNTYYEHQFEQLANSKKVADAEFLYTVKLCYDLALDRKVSLVEYLQSQIFGSTSPKNISRNLGSWVYLSGYVISMHDVPRNAIKFSDQIQIRITEYLIGNFSGIISNHEDQLSSTGAFFGRNIQLLMQHDNNHEHFLPHHIYQFMKSQRQFEVAIGRGAGEVFYLLGQPLQEEILSRIEKDGEFARGLGESLGESFEGLDDEIRTDIFSRRINQSILFARGLGESLGNNFSKLPKALQDEIFQISLKERNYNFLRGLGVGLGRKFRRLEADIQKRLLALTLQHIPLAIGVGYGLGLDFTSSSMPKEFQNDIMGWTKENGEITRGLGMGLGHSYPFLNRMLQREILGWTEKNPRLEFGFAYQLGFLFTSLTKEYQNFISNRVERNSEFAYGSGWGLGVVYTYLPKDIQQQLLDLSKKYIRFGIGLGSGIGNQLQYLTKDREEEFFSNVENNDGFATGAGFGIGRVFTFLREDLQQKVWHLTKTNYRFAVGLGWGLGFTFSYLHENLQNEVLENIQKEFGFASGFGWGLGFMFTYLSSDFQQKANLLALQNSQFAYGFGIGLGSLFIYLPKDSQQEIWKRAESNAQFAIGLGSELGYLFTYLPAQLQEDVMSRSQSNSFIARGLGWGLGDIFTFLSKDRQQYLLKNAQRNPQLLRGLGWGLGRVLVYLTAELQQTIVKIADTNAQFAIGLGEGIGHSFQHPDSQFHQWVINLCDKNNAIARGLGIGLGHILRYLQPISQQEIWKRAESNAQFAIGLGEGLGAIIGFSPLSSQDEIFARMEQNVPLSRGLGSGLGCTHSYLKDNIISSKVFGYIKKNKEFCRGYGEGLGRIFCYWTKSTVNDVTKLNTALKGIGVQFAIGLGEGIGQSLPYGIWQSITDRSIGDVGTNGSRGNTNKHTTTLIKLFALDGFSYGVGLGFSSIVEFIPDQTRPSILQVLIPKYQNFAFGFGNGIGRAFPSLSQELREEVLELVEKSNEFAAGLGQGLGFSFKYLEPIVQQGLMIFMERSNEFAAGLGQGLGNIFPSLSQELREEVLELVEKSNEFAAGLGQGLNHNLAYLDEMSQAKLAGSAKIKDYANKPLHDQGKKDTIAEFARHDNDFSLLPGLHGRYIVDKINTRLEQEPDLLKENLVDQEILFSGRRENYCICYIDMMNSTQISSTLNDLQLSKYYSIFLNSMATIAKNFGAVIIKNAGDCLIHYFPSTSNSNEQIVFKNVIECGITMISAHQAINSKLFEQRLPPLHYRISADYGKVEVARSSSSQSEDLFGSVMNVCAKINSKAPTNGMVIGHKLHQIVDAATEKEYKFEKIGEYSGFKEVYPIYSVKTKKKRNILNPFRKTTETTSNLNLEY